MNQSGVLLAVVVAAVLAAGCTQASIPSDGSGTSPSDGNNVGVTGNQQTDWAAIVQLEQQAKSVARTSGCASPTECRSAPVGSRACGGPRYYIPWCSKTTDSAALYSKLGEIAKAEQAYNKKYQIVSTCEFRLPPAAGISAGACTAK